LVVIENLAHWEVDPSAAWGRQAGSNASNMALGRDTGPGRLPGGIAGPIVYAWPAGWDQR
jgi:hypothetical protein